MRGLAAWRRPVLGAALAVLIAVGALDRDLSRVLGPLPSSEVGAGVAMAFGLALVLATPRHRGLPARVAWLVGGGLVGGLVALGVDLDRLGHVGILAGACSGIALGGVAVAVSVAGDLGWLVALVVAVAVPVVADTGLRDAAERVAAGFVVGPSAWVHAAVVAVVGAALGLVVPSAREVRRSSQRPVREDSLALRLLLRAPGLAIGALDLARRAPRSLVRLVVLAEAMVFLGVATSEGVLVAGLALGALGLIFGRELERQSADLLDPVGVLAVLPRRRGTFGRRAAVVPMALGAVLLGVAAACLWHAVGLEGPIVVIGCVVGGAVGCAGSGVAAWAVQADPGLARGRLLAGFIPLVLAVGSAAPAIQLNNAFAAHGFFVEYVIGGASFAIVVGLVGLSLTSWWRVEVYG